MSGVKFTPIRRLRAGRLLVDKPGLIEGWWRDVHICAERHDDRDGRWYIEVHGPGGCYLYDGWWRNSEGKPVEDAVAEAFRGAQLIELYCKRSGIAGGEA
ncbi:hypothetical protein [Paraburkholderia tropica]|uniref:hypothetical protein n=1 Tax=Paraburkholderia tropica TaxID=92647 RepID=UPI001F18ADCF|nr:hypothetical protein [Paraburkholderia tropica]